MRASPIARGARSRACALTLLALCACAAGTAAEAGAEGGAGAAAPAGQAAEPGSAVFDRAAAAAVEAALPDAERSAITAKAESFFAAVAAGRMDEAMALVEERRRDRVRTAASGYATRIPAERRYEVVVIADGDVVHVALVGTALGIAFSKLEAGWMITR